MKLVILTAIAALTVQAAAQTPGRKIQGGGSSTPGVVVTPKTPTKKVTKKVTYMALGPRRQWLSRDGKSILAQLVAFDLGNEATYTPPTVIKEEKIRLIKDGKEFLYPVDKLDAKHQEDVLEIEDKLKKTYAAKKAAAG